MGVFYEFDEVDAFTVGAIGEPGQRIVLAPGPPRRHAGHREVREAAGGGDRRVPAQGDAATCRRRTTGRCPAALELAEPIEPAFVLGPIGLGYDRATDRVLVQLEEVVPVDEEGEPDPEAVEDRGHVRVFLTRGQAVAFCDTPTIVAAGRPACMWCGNPMDPDGHACPRMN